MGIFSSIWDTASGLAMGAYNDRRQLEQQKKLMDLQMQGQKEMGQFNQGLALDLWDKTNYSAQVQQLEKAGLNTGLLYGMGGSGGAISQSNAGNVTGATAQPAGNPAEMALQLAGLSVQKAQKENIEADTKKKEVETDKLAGIDTEEGKQRIVESLKGMDLTDTQIKKLASETNKTEQEIKNLITGEEVMRKDIEKTDAEIEEIAQMIGKSKQEVKNLIEQNKLLRAQTTQTEAETKLTEAQTKQVKQATQKIVADIQNGIIQLDQKDIELKQGEWRIKNEAVKTKIDAHLRSQGLDTENKRVMNEALRTIILGSGLIPNTRPVIGY